nr:glycine-rich RNA-binding protein-like [Arachis hypogaea]
MQLTNELGKELVFGGTWWAEEQKLDSERWCWCGSGVGDVAARRRSLVEAGRRFSGWGRKGVMEGRREEGGEEGEGCGGHGGRRFWAWWCGGASVMQWKGQWREKGGRGRRGRKEGKGGGGEGCSATGGRGGAAGARGGWSVVGAGEKREGCKVGEGEMVTRGARVSRGMG